MPSPPAGDDGTLLDTPNQMEQSNQSDLDPVELPEAELDQPVEGEPDGPGEGGGGRRRRVLALAVGGLDPDLLERDPEFDSEEFSFERGLSLPLLRGLVDDMEILPREGRGATLRMRLALTGEDAPA